MSLEGTLLLLPLVEDSEHLLVALVVGRFVEPTSLDARFDVLAVSSLTGRTYTTRWSGVLLDSLLRNDEVVTFRRLP